MVPMPFSRRSILYLIPMLFNPLLMASVFKAILFRPKQKVTPPRIENRYTEQGKTLVGVVGGRDAEEMVREAVNLIGGWERININGKTVLVKPNVVSGVSSPTTTNPAVVRAAVKILYNEGASKVIVGDMSALMTLSTKRNMVKTGIKRASEEAGAEVIYFEDHDWVEVELKGARYIKRLYVSEWIYRVDRVINLPVIKTHRSATYSICLKNFVGATHTTQRPYFIDEEHWEEVVSEINLAYQPHLNIVDGTRSMVAGGPWEGTAVDTNIIMASGDRVAADVVGLGIIKSFGKWPMVVDIDVWDQRQIKRAIELGIGVGKGNIKLVDKVLAGANPDFSELVNRVKRIV